VTWARVGQLEQHIGVARLIQRTEASPILTALRLNHLGSDRLMDPDPAAAGSAGTG
jgi:hypothetical protein